MKPVQSSFNATRKLLLFGGECSAVHNAPAVESYATSVLHFAMILIQANYQWIPKDPLDLFWS